MSSCRLELPPRLLFVCETDAYLPTSNVSFSLMVLPLPWISLFTDSHQHTYHHSFILSLCFCETHTHTTSLQPMAQNVSMPLFGRAAAASGAENHWNEVDHFDVDILAEYLLDDGFPSGGLSLDLS